MLDEMKPLGAEDVRSEAQAVLDRIAQRMWDEGIAPSRIDRAPVPEGDGTAIGRFSSFKERPTDDLQRTLDRIAQRLWDEGITPPGMHRDPESGVAPPVNTPDCRQPGQPPTG